MIVVTFAASGIKLLLSHAAAFRQGGREAVIDLCLEPSVGAEIVLTADGEWRRTRLFRAHGQTELSAAIADTRAAFEGWL